MDISNVEHINMSLKQPQKLQVDPLFFGEMSCDCLEGSNQGGKLPKKKVYK